MWRRIGGALGTLDVCGRVGNCKFFLVKGSFRIRMLMLLLLLLLFTASKSPTLLLFLRFQHFIIFFLKIHLGHRRGTSC